MKLSVIAAALGAASLVTAQPDLSSLPQCAQDCAMAYGQLAPCSPDDFACYCTSVDFVNAITACIAVQCKTPDDLAAAMAAIAQICAGSSAVSSILSTASAASAAKRVGTSTEDAGIGATPTPTATETSTSTGVAATLLPGGFATAALVAAIFAL